MGEIVSIGRGSELFSLKGANQLVPIVRRICEQYSTIVDRLVQHLGELNPKDQKHVAKIEATIDERIQSWNLKIKKLGALPKGMWIVDFDSGNGYFCWKYPEPAILYWHGYNEGFSNRLSIEEWKVSKEQRPLPIQVENPPSTP